VPVRISLDPRELAENPLRVGLSMEARIDVREPTETDVASN
jgi:membrane fusion protein (multidrug efflux system)